MLALFTYLLFTFTKTAPRFAEVFTSVKCEVNLIPAVSIEETVQQR